MLWILFWIILALLPFLAQLLAQIIVAIESKNPEKITSWLAIYAIWPFFGVLLYFIFGYSPRKLKLFHSKHLPSNKLERITNHQQEKFTASSMFLRENSIMSKRLVRLSLESGLAPLSLNNKISVLKNGDEKFESLLRDLKEAKKHIHMNYYIFRADQIGMKIHDLLIEKAHEGLEVRLIFDGLGSRHLPKHFLRSMKDAGIQIGWFFPLRFPDLIRTLNYRDHRKLVVIDGKVGYLGGINVGDEYLSRDPKFGFWRDTHLRLQGECVHTMQATFLNDWYFVTQEAINHQGYYPEPDSLAETLTQIISGGPDSAQESIKELFFTIIATAQTEIQLTTPYFIPDESMVMALKSAALSGLDVQVLVQGVPDHKIPFLASTSYFEDLLEAGVKIYRYKKGILHSKVLTVDKKICIVGSANFDIRSFLIDFEISAIIYDSKFALRLSHDFEQDLQDSKLIDLEAHGNRPLLQKVKEANARLLSPLL